MTLNNDIKLSINISRINQNDQQNSIVKANEGTSKWL
jgi:hypothetical protein